MNKKILALTVSKQWFDMIIAGKKTEEYREIKGFWMSRLLLIKDEESKEFKKATRRKERGNAYRYRHYQGEDKRWCYEVRTLHSRPLH